MGWYVVTNGKICFRDFAFSWSADFLPVKATSDNVFLYHFVRIAVCNETRSKICDTVIKGCFRRVCSKKSKGFIFNKTFFNTWWVVQGKMCVLKGFSRLVMSIKTNHRPHVRVVLGLVEYC